MSNNFFSMQGRVNRAKYFVNILLILIVTYLVVVICSPIFESSTYGSSNDSGKGIFGLIVMIGHMTLIAFQIVKRFHDLGKPGSYYWLLWLPLINIYWTFALLFMKGVEGPNEYGDDLLSKLKNVPTTVQSINDTDIKKMNNEQLRNKSISKYHGITIVSSGLKPPILFISFCGNF